jgi:hypothetical protein
MVVSDVRRSLTRNFELTSSLRCCQSHTIRQPTAQIEHVNMLMSRGVEGNLIPSGASSVPAYRDRHTTHTYAGVARGVSAEHEAPLPRRTPRFCLQQAHRSAAPIKAKPFVTLQHFRNAPKSSLEISRRESYRRAYASP